ncbi:MAG: hypothetical protein NUV34_07470 [Sulfuricaulis sp.]|nr:hypothetical protein [Sulfuricaulis sp.]
MAKETFSETMAAFLARRPSLSEAQARLDETSAALVSLRERHDVAIKAADDAAVAAAEGMPGADTQRDRSRAKARQLREDIHDAEALLQKRRERLEDAKTAERAKATAAIWEEAEKYFARREEAASCAQAAIDSLAQALADLHSETALIHVLLEGKAAQYLDLGHVRGTIDVLLTEALTGKKTHIQTRPPAELVADQHGVIRSATKL